MTSVRSQFLLACWVWGGRSLLLACPAFRVWGRGALPTARMRHAWRPRSVPVSLSLSLFPLSQEGRQGLPPTRYRAIGIAGRMTLPAEKSLPTSPFAAPTKPSILSLRFAGEKSTSRSSSSVEGTHGLHFTSPGKSPRKWTRAQAPPFRHLRWNRALGSFGRTCVHWLVQQVECVR